MIGRYRRVCATVTCLAEQLDCRRQRNSVPPTSSPPPLSIFFEPKADTATSLERSTLCKVKRNKCQLLNATFPAEKPVRSVSGDYFCFSWLDLTLIRAEGDIVRANYLETSNAIRSYTHFSVLFSQKAFADADEKTK